MTQETVFRILTFLLLLSVLSLGGYFRYKAEREGGRMKSTEGNRLVVLLRLLALLVVGPLLVYLVNPDWVAWARVPLPDWVRWTAAVVAVCTLPGFYWLLASIGTNITATQGTRVGHKLVTHGPYHWVRHPLYSIGFVFVICLTLLTALWWMAVAMGAPLAILLWRTPKEEARLVETFGDDYRDYMKRTGRFLPRWDSIWQTAGNKKGDLTS
jgi:protein-S-isoprenylcysteine O-methyltransferase Ste14